TQPADLGRGRPRGRRDGAVLLQYPVPYRSGHPGIVPGESRTATAAADACDELHRADDRPSGRVVAVPAASRQGSSEVRCARTTLRVFRYRTVGGDQATAR